MVILDFGDIAGILIFGVIMLISIISSIAKKAKEKQETERSRFSPPSNQRVSREYASHSSVEYDPDLAPGIYDDPADDAGLDIVPLSMSELNTGSAQSIAKEAAPARRRGAAAAKARVAEERHAEGHNLAERVDRAEGASLVSVREMLRGKARQGILISEILSAPRCRRRLSRRD